MSVIINGNELRAIALGRYTQGKTSTITADTTYQVFTVADGEVLITALWGKVTTAITDAGEDLQLQLDPDAGATVALCQNSGDIGTSDTPAGSLITFAYDQDGTTNTPLMLVGPFAPLSFVATSGEIELVVGTGSGAEDGVIEWYCTWVPLTNGATVSASA